jgi:nicotinate phosphoribosyltransferase
MANPTPRHSPSAGVFGLPFDADALASLRVTLASRNATARATFECSFVSLSESTGFVILAGLEPLLASLEQVRLSAHDADWLVETGLWDEATAEAAGDMRLHVDVDAVPEGTAVFPGEAVLCIDGPLWQAQLVASLALRTLGDASSVATRFARIAIAGERSIDVVEISSAREANAERACTLARSAYIGGASSTTSTHAARSFGIPLRARESTIGLGASRDRETSHRAWFQSSPAGALVYFEPSQPEHSAERLAVAALGNTADSWESRPFAVEIPGGHYVDLAEALARAFVAREVAAPQVYLSGILDEFAVRELRREIPELAGVCVDATRLAPVVQVRAEVVAMEEDGRWSPRMRYADSLVACSDPGRKLVMRYFDAHGHPVADVAHATNERMQSARGVEFVDRVTGARTKVVAQRGAPLLSNVMRAGKRSITPDSLEIVRNRAQTELSALSDREKRLTQPSRYPVGLTDALFALKTQLFDAAEEHRTPTEE